MYFTTKKFIINKKINGLCFYSYKTTGGGIAEAGGNTEVIWHGPTSSDSLSKYYGGNRNATTAKAHILTAENPVRDSYLDHSSFDWLASLLRPPFSVLVTNRRSRKQLFLDLKFD